MKREDFTIDGIPEGYIVYDVDLTPSGRPVPVVGHRTDDTQAVFCITRAGRLPLPDPLWRHSHYPDRLLMSTIVRSAGEDNLVVIQTQNYGEPRSNGHVWDIEGNVKASFEAGYNMREVLSNREVILLLYDDEAQTGDFDLGRQALVVWSIGGEFLWGHVSQFPNEHLDTWSDAASWISDDEVAIWADVTGHGFTMRCSYIHLNLRDRTQQVFPPPDAWYMPSAISTLQDRVLAYGAHARGPGPLTQGLRWLKSLVGRPSLSAVVEKPPVTGDDIISWLPGTNDWEIVGSFDGYLRGLPGGRYISPRPDGYTILSFD